jgi:hypothetical protein
MEVFQNGRFSTGEPVYQIGVKNSDGTYDVKVFDLMSKEQAEAKLIEMGVKPVASPTDVENMTKLELEAMMREHGVELDRRETKGALLRQVKNFFNG